MVLNEVYLVTTYLHLRPRQSSSYPLNLPSFKMPPCCCASLLPGMPFSSFTPGKLQCTLFINSQVINPLGSLLLLPFCCYTCCTSTSSGLSCCLWVVYSSCISLNATRMLSYLGTCLFHVASRTQHRDHIKSLAGGVIIIHAVNPHYCLLCLSF